MNALKKEIFARILRVFFFIAAAVASTHMASVFDARYHSTLYDNDFITDACYFALNFMNVFSVVCVFLAIVSIFLDTRGNE